MTLAVLGLIAGVIGMAPNAMVERFVVGSGDADKFDVLVGRRLNDRPLTRTEAYRLAGWSSPAGSTADSAGTASS
jgi:hypothetical protein